MMEFSANYRAGRGVAVLALLVGALVWGLIWYPYRMLESAGLPGAWATTLTYLIALLIGGAVFRDPLRQLCQSRPDAWWLAIALSAGACNLGYVLAMLHGEVMRVLLLFYLAPFWTVLLARWLLNERVKPIGALVVALSLLGAAVMLWRPALGLPWPNSESEWLGLAAGMLFALSNVLIRRAKHYPVAQKSLAVFAGVTLVGLVCGLLWQTGDIGQALDWLNWASFGLVVLVGLILLAVNLVVQYGLEQVSASRAVVILLFELPVAALASWLLAGEAMGVQESLGGLLIASAGFFSAKLETD